MKPTSARKKIVRSSFASTAGGFVAAAAPADRGTSSRESLGQSKR